MNKLVGRLAREPDSKGAEYQQRERLCVSMVQSKQALMVGWLADFEAPMHMSSQLKSSQFLQVAATLYIDRVDMITT